MFQDFPAHFRLQNDLVHLNLEWDQPGFIVKSVTGWQYLAHQQREDSSRSAFSVIGQYDDVAAWDTWVQNWTQEFDIQSPAGQRGAVLAFLRRPSRVYHRAGLSDMDKRWRCDL